MKPPLRVLVVEDSPDDYDLLLLELGRGNFDLTHERVETADAMRNALRSGAWDLILSDFSLPQFSAMAALGVLKEAGVDIPFIVVSGTISEDMAVDAMKAGAHDFLLKDRMARLLPAIERELREVRSRQKRREAEEEKKKVEAQLLVADRMVAVGTLAAGVAHEINNPLAALMANLELAVADVASLAQGDTTKETLAMLAEELADARAAAERVRNIVRDLKIFSRGGDQERRGPVDVERVMESTLRMAWNEIRHRAKVVKNYEKVPPVHASESRLGQVFLNLIVNAAQAIGEGKAAENQLTIGIRTQGDRILVEIADSGPGIPPEVMKRLFTPFVTTKPIGVGTGLGLSICHRLVTEMGGEIGVESEAARGATFRVLLPVSTGEERASEAAQRADTTPAIRGRVLVIDDEAMIGAAIERTVSSQHDVETTTRARDALDRIAAGERFDVILCDLMMPELTGMDFHEELLRRFPEQADRVVFLTGGAFTQRAREFLDQVPNPRMEKPFDAAQLRAIINDRMRSG